MLSRQPFHCHRRHWVAKTGASGFPALGERDRARAAVDRTEREARLSFEFWGRYTYLGQQTFCFAAETTGL